jgi:ketosteroid isomerase-like protein
MKKVLSLPVVFFVMILLSGSCFAQEWSAEQKDVWAGVEKYWEASESGNASAFMQYFDDSYNGWDYQSPVPMSKANTTKWVDYGTSAYTNVVYSITPLKIWVKGDFAYVDYVYAELDKNKETGKIENNSGNWTDILMKEDGVWKLIGDHGGRTSKSE